MNLFSKIFIVITTVFSLGLSAQNVRVIDDSFINAGETKTLTADTTWVLDGYVYVEDGATLNIEPGTVVKGKPGDINDPQGPTALVIARGGKIMAEGTQNDPIIFTAEEDDVDDLTDVDIDEVGLWGGIIILGNATINVPGGEEQIEGIPSNEVRGAYGGDDDNDNSGVMKYVSIRHGGVNIGGDNNEINGLTLGGVGSGTELDYIEIWSNLDDGIEFFGGTASVKHAVVAFCGDDAFDYDNGWRGKGQFWFTIQGEESGGYAGEHDGGSVNDDDEPYAIPTIYNVTYVGSGQNSTNPDSEVFLIRDNAGGKYRNSIFTDFVGGIEIEDKGAGSSRERLTEGDLELTNNIWWNVADNSLETIAPQDFVRNYLFAFTNNNSVEDPMLAGISRSQNQMLDLRPQPGSPATTNPTAEYPQGDDFFTPVDYYGAFESSSNGQNWIKGWTYLDQLGFVGDLWNNTTGQVVIDDSYISAGETKTLTADTEWILDGYVYVEEGATLNIEPGTVIKGKPGDINDPQGPTALVIARGGKIMAEGTAEAPIIFTAEEDDVNDLTDVDVDEVGLWGGIIILGNATINVPGGEEQIEGIPSNEVRGAYGGDDDNDNSGILKYVSIRHGGVNIGGDNNEINGLTLGGVGSGTELDYIEIWSNLDDGIEFFGGTASVKHAVVAFCGDDAFDYDNGWRGKGQFWFTIQGENSGGYAGEHDGGSVNDDDEPYAIPTIYNVTYVGSGQTSDNPDSEVFLIRDNAGGKYRNSIFTDFIGGIEIEDKGEGSSRERLETGDLELTNNIWWNIADNSLAEIAPQDFVQTYLVANNNTIEDPMLAGISRSQDQGLDLRPSAGSPALTNETAAYPEGDDFFTPVDYYGAFESSSVGQNWIKGWTYLDQLGYVGDKWVNETGQVVIDDSYINAGETKTLTADTEWILDGYVYVEDGAVLNIEPGTVIKGKPGDINDPQGPTALVIARGGKIFAEGTAEAPIIFTAEEDDVNDPTDVDIDEVGLWGGIIVLGNATINVPGGEEQIEGIPSNEVRGAYGGDDDNDNSGVMKYVSIRHGGVNIGGDNNEINGLTLGGVGAGTELDYIEIWSNLDDGIEFFGGTASVKHAVVAFCGDDAFDYDNGWRGKGQFWFTIQGENSGGYAGEHDGGSVNDDDEPYAIPTIYNVTYVGSGQNADNPDSEVFLIRDNAGGKYRNSIFTDFVGGIEIEDKGEGSSKERLDEGDLELTNNIWWNIADNSLAGIAPQDFVQTYLGANNNTIEDPMLAGISRSQDQGLDLRPASGSPALTNETAAYPEGDEFFTNVDYYGAFDASQDGQDWIKGWTYLDELGFVGDLWVNETGSVVIDDSYINAGETKTLTADTEWILDGYVYVEDGATLIIEPGTVVKGKPGDINDPQGPTALVIARGGKIMAEGTAEEPIIFTAEEDDVNDLTDVDVNEVGLWGGIIVLGNATINVPGGEEQIEGIPSNEVRGAYGGTDDNDNSGVMKYVSIRHGGVNIGGDNNEINGLTLGGVGAGTELDYIEIWSNLDDGIEFFGGTASVKHAVVAFCGDDAFDYDNGWRGKGQFWFTIQGENSGGYAGEHDGGSVNDDDEPYAIPTIYNVTYVGSGQNADNPDSEVFLIRDNAGGKYRNSIFTDFVGGIEIEDKGAGSSKERLDEGDLELTNNIWWNIADNSLAGIAPQDFVQTYLGANNNTIEDPMLAGISRTQQDEGLDLRPLPGSPATNNPAAEYPEGDNFFTPVNYYGAFASSAEGQDWIKGWTYLDQLGYVGDIWEPSSVRESNLTTDNNINVYPNPVENTAKIEFVVKTNSHIEVAVFTSAGQRVATLENSFHTAGLWSTTWNANGVPAGAYIVNVTSDNGSYSQTIIVK